MEIIVDYAVIGKHMKEIRKRMGLTQALMAERFGVSTGYYASLETGQNKISFARFVQLIMITQVPADFFLKGCCGEMMDEMQCGQYLSAERMALDALLNRCSDQSVKAIHDVCKALDKHLK